MAGLSISPPGVEVIQEFVATSPTAITPFLPTVFVGPAFQVVSSFDDLGNPLDDAFAGTYRDGLGLIAFDLPSLISEASLVGFEDEVRVFLIAGTDVTELNSEDDEEVIVDDGTGDFATGSPDTFTDLTQLFLQIGVEVGDYVRVTYQAEIVDIEITDVTSDTLLELAASAIGESLVGLTYDIVRNPAQFIFDAALQANAEIGTEADYIRFTAQLLKTDGITPGDYVGSAGDAVSIVFTDSEHFLDGADGVVGDSIFKSATATFLSDVGARGAVASEILYVGSGADDGGVFRDVIEVVSDTQIHVESGEGVGLSGLTYRVGDDAGATFTAASGATDATVGTGCVLTVTAGNFTTSIGAVGPAPANTYVELSAGVYLVEAVNSDDSIDIFSTAASVNLSGEDPVILLQTATAADGATGALTDFATITQTLTALADDATEAINFGGVNAAPLTSVTDADNAVVGAGAPGVLTSGPTQAFSAVLLVSPLTLSWDSEAVQVTVELERGATDAGVTASTFAEIEDAIDTLANPSYNATVTDVIDATVAGAGTTILGEADVGTTLQLDGGSDDEQLLLDADLLGSGTPTGQVYVSYKALRIDLSAASASYVSPLFIENPDQREALLGPATVDNPLSLAVAFALSNSPTQGVFALGLGEVNAAKPEGTVASYTQAFSALEPVDIHLVNPLTQDLTVAQNLQVHVDALSEPDQKSERIGFFNSVLPEYNKADVLASGTQGNSGTGSGGTPLKMTGENPADFRTSVDLALAEVQAGDILVVTAFSGEDTELTAVNGTIGPLYGLVVVSPATKVGDDFVLQVDASGLTDTSFDSLIDVNWTVYRAGSAITQAVNQGEVIAQTSEGFADRRMYHHWPDLVTADVDGTEFLLPGYYAMAAWGGKANQVSPEKGLSNATIAGFTGLRNSNGYFNKGQLDRIAGGGTWITIQESQNAPLKCRHQLSTDTSTIEKREFSITRVVDYTAKYLRLGLNRQVGKFNITKSYLDGLSVTVQGLLLGLEEAGKLVSASLISLEVDPVQPDKINLVVAIDVPFPANFIEITLQI